MAFGIKLSLSVCSNAGNTFPKQEKLSMSWAERKIKELAQGEADQKETERIKFARDARIRTESGLLWDNLKQTLRRNIQEFNASKARYFQTKDSGMAADYESHQVISPK